MMSIKKWLDDHPAAVILGIAVSVATTTSAVTTYFTQQIHGAEKAQLVSKHHGEISDLTSRLSSIERRAGPNQQKRYLDVQSMQISPSEVRNLARQFQSFDNGNFFLSVPISGNWTYGVLSYADITKLGPFRQAVDDLNKNPKIKEMMDRNKVHTWYSSPVANVQFAVETNDLKWRGPIASHVKIQKVTRDEYVANAAAYAGLARKPSSESKDVSIAIDALQRKSEGDATKDGDDKNSEASDSLEEKRLLEQVFDGDTAGLIFVDILFQNLVAGTSGPHVSFSILSAQKQLNVMYVDLEIRLSRTQIETSQDETCKAKTTPTVALRREIFFVSYGGGGYLISTEVPTCDGRSKAFDWISQWLAGLRIAVKSVN